MQTTRSSTASGGKPDDEISRLVRGESVDPHRTLGAHPDGSGGMVVRVLRPEATAVRVLWDNDAPVALRQVHAAGLFEGRVPGTQARPYRLQVDYADRRFELEDPYRFWPTLGELDLHLIGEGRHLRLWDRLGAHPRVLDGVAGTSFGVWAPNARSVRVVGDFNSWDGRLNPMRELGSSGIWELFVPGVEHGARYKYELVGADGYLRLKADPLAFAAELAPQTASIVYESTYQWGDEAWLGMRVQRDQLRAQMSIYEVHLGSWRQGRTYRQLATELVDYVDQLGFTHVELLPIAEHPFGGSWGYQVTGYYAPTARYGTPDDFRALVDAFHQRGIGVIIDWVPAHFPKDEWALARFDGTPLYEHADPRRGEHPDWGSLVFNLGRNEVRNFLLANALYWVEEFHIDALRVDAVASMLYLDYSRKAGEWIPNIYGGNEDLDAVSFLRECNIEIYGRNPGCFVIAEESTAWPGVSRPAYLGGLGFGFKWNMGWMHDTLSYFSYDPIYRRYHHNELTFSLLYAFSENYILPLSHDEVVHGKGSLIAKMPGDDWQKFANLRALYGYMWAHPGKQLLFMGDELGQRGEWRHEGEIDFESLADPLHRGIQELVRDLNRIGRTLPALWERDCEADGFRWIEGNDPESNVIAFLRYAADGSPVVCVANLSPVPRLRYRFGLPVPGAWREALNTDAGAYGGAGMGNLGKVEATMKPWNGLPASAELTLPPLATIWLLPT